METIEQVIQMTKDTSRGIVESGQEHKPILIMLAPTEVINTLIPWIEKENFKEVISQLLRHFHAYAYIFINEGWAAKLDNGSPLFQELLSGRKKVLELPLDDREEMLMIMAAENKKSYRMWTANIRYTHDDKRYLGEWKEADNIGEGRMMLKEW